MSSSVNVASAILLAIFARIVVIEICLNDILRKNSLKIGAFTRRLIRKKYNQDTRFFNMGLEAVS
jgi:hypothetical protein